MKIAYFVHDLADPAVHRRVRMLRSFAEVTLLGFHRSDGTTPCSGPRTIDLGRTTDARLGQRAIAVLRAASLSPRWHDDLAGSTIFIARQLEMLVVAALTRRWVAPGAPLVFECLDIHRLMLTNRLIGIALRGLERRLLRSCGLLIVSSPAFLTNHFARYGAILPPSLLLENKVLAEEVPSDVLERIEQSRQSGTASGPPWRIGWFGVIRCRRSLEILANLALRLPGVIEVVIRGRPKRDVIPDFDRLVAGTPGLSFLGEYDRHTELSAIYRDVHFTWAIDFYEVGQNSAWLLPNRLYEGTLHGAVPLVVDHVQTGHWLRDRQCGVRLEDTGEHGLEQAVCDYFTGLDAERYALARRALARVPLSDLIDGTAARDRFAAVLEALSRRV